MSNILLARPSYSVNKLILCGSRKYPYPPGRIMEIPRGRGSERGRFPKGRGAT